MRTAIGCQLAKTIPIAGDDCGEYNSQRLTDEMQYLVHPPDNMVYL
jgi:hypothetical protein